MGAVPRFVTDSHTRGGFRERAFNRDDPGAQVEGHVDASASKFTETIGGEVRNLGYEAAGSRELCLYREESVHIGAFTHTGITRLRGSSYHQARHHIGYAPMCDPTCAGDERLAIVPTLSRARVDYSFGR